MKLIVAAIIVFKDFAVFLASSGLLFGLYLRPSVSDRTDPQDEPILPRWQVTAFKLLYTVRYLIARVGQYVRPVFRLLPAVLRAQQAVEHRALRHLEAIGYPIQKDGEIPCVDSASIDPEAFVERYIVRPHPVVLRGFALDTAAVRNWTPQYIGSVSGEMKALSMEATDEKGSGVLGYLRFGREKMQDVVDSIVSDGAGRKKSIINMKNLFLEHPELLAQLEVNKVSRFAGGLKYSLTDFMMAGGEAFTPFHCANGFNFFFMVQGRKRWTFVHPNHTYLMYPMFRARFVEGMSRVGHHLHLGDGAKDVPLFKYCPRLSVVLEPGDVLLNPPWWWHEVANESETTIAAASRWGYDTYPSKTNTLFDLFQWLFPIMWGLKIISKARDPRLMALSEDGGGEPILLDGWSSRLNDDDGTEDLQYVDEDGGHRGATFV